MTGICTACSERQRVPSHRGDRMADYHCYKCGAPLKGVGAGASKRQKCVHCGQLTEMIAPSNLGPLVATEYVPGKGDIGIGVYRGGEPICRKLWLRTDDGHHTYRVRPGEVGSILHSWQGDCCAIGASEKAERDRNFEASRAGLTVA